HLYIDFSSSICGGATSPACSIIARIALRLLASQPCNKSWAFTLCNSRCSASRACGSNANRPNLLLRFSNRHRFVAETTGPIKIQIERQSCIEIALRYLRTFALCWLFSFEIEAEINTSVLIAIPKLIIFSLKAGESMRPRTHCPKIDTFLSIPTEKQIETHD